MFLKYSNIWQMVSLINSDLNSVRKHNYNCMLDDGIYYQVNNYVFRPIAAIFRLLQFCSKIVIYVCLYCVVMLRSQHHHAV